MKMDRNRWLLVGLLVLFLGLEFRFVERVTLTQEMSETLAFNKEPEAANAAARFGQIFPAVGPTIPQQSFNLPRWMGWLLISVGSVIVLQSFVMPKPGG